MEIRKGTKLVAEIPARSNLAFHGDDIVVCHPDHPPRKITKYGLIELSLDEPPPDFELTFRGKRLFAAGKS